MILVDNKLQVAKIRLAFILTIVAGTILVIYSVFFKVQENVQIISLSAGIILYLLFLYLLLVKPEYIYFSVENNKKLLVRNYTAFPLFRKYKAFEIQLQSIHGYEIKTAFFNQIKLIRIHVIKNNKVGKYPWLSLSAMPKSEFEKLTTSLDKLLPPEKRKKRQTVV